MVRLSWRDEVPLSSHELAAVSLLAALLCVAVPARADRVASLCRLLLGTLYPAYASYKAVRTKDVKAYVSSPSKRPQQRRRLVPCPVEFPSSV